MSLLRSCESLWTGVETVDFGETPLKPVQNVVRYNIESDLVLQHPAALSLARPLSLQVSYCCYRCKDKAAEKHRPVCEAFGWVI